MDSLDLKSLSKSPLFVAALLILPVDGERDVFVRVCRLRRFSMIVAFILAVLAVFVLPGAGKFVSVVLAAAFSFYSIYQLTSLRRLARDNAYIARDIYEIFWPLLALAAIIIIGAAVLVAWGLFSVFASGVQAYAAPVSMLLGILLLVGHLYLVEKVWAVYRSSLNALGSQ
jgi:hypothetical protein